MKQRPCNMLSSLMQGMLQQCRRALKPDGLFLAAMFGGDTLHELRVSCNLAEEELQGGVSQRVSPLAQVRHPCMQTLLHPHAVSFGFIMIPGRSLDARLWLTMNGIGHGTVLSSLVVVITYLAQLFVVEPPCALSCSACLDLLAQQCCVHPLYPLLSRHVAFLRIPNSS